MFSLYSNRTSLRILWGPNNLHQLSGPITTPLFKHLGLSSWHSVDGAILRTFKTGRLGRALGLMLKIVGFMVTVHYLRKLHRARMQRNRRIEFKREKGEEGFLV
jgi:hypothetical protein